MKRPTEKEYQEAALLWREQNPGKKNISVKAEVILPNGKVIKIGSRVRSIKNGQVKLSNEDKPFWEAQGAYDSACPTEKEYQEAALLWREQNPGKKNISVKAEVILPNGKVIKIGSHVQSIKNGQVRLSDEDKPFWEAQGAYDSIHPTEEEYQEAALIWKEQNPGKKNIPVKAEVMLLNGKIIKIGRRITYIKNGQVKLSNEDKLFWEAQGAYDSARSTEKEYQQAALLWREQNPGKKNIPQSAEVTLPNGKIVKIGRRIAYIKDSRVKLSDEDKPFWILFGIFTKEEKITTAKKSTVEKYTDYFHGNREKAERVVTCLKSLREKRAKEQKQEWNVDNLLAEFGINIKHLQATLNRTRNTDNSKDREEVLTYQDQTLRQFCIEQGYNYEVVARAVRLHPYCVNDSFEQLINRVLTTYQKEGQHDPSTWIYEKYGVLVKHALTYLHLDQAAILRNMSHKIISLEEAIRHEIFIKERKTKENAWLEVPYEYLIAELNSEKDQETQELSLVNKFSQLVGDYQLEKEEYQILWNALTRYVTTMKEYQIVDVGLTRRPEEKQSKIRAYNMEDADIEESYFVPLAFSKGVLLGPKSKHFQRRNLIRQYTIDWNFYGQEERKEIIQKETISQKEFYYIETTRKAIDNMIIQSKSTRQYSKKNS